METVTTSNSKITIIALGLLFLIPITINLGLNIILPKVAWQSFKNSENDFLKKNMPSYDEYQKMILSTDLQANPEKRVLLFKEYDEYQAKWRNSTILKKLQTEQNNQEQTRFIAFIVIILTLMIIINFITIPTITLSIMGSTLYLFIFELNDWTVVFNSPIKEGFLFGIPLPLVGIATSFICLVLTVYYAHKNQL